MLRWAENSRRLIRDDPKFPFFLLSWKWNIYTKKGTSFCSQNTVDKTNYDFIAFFVEFKNYIWTRLAKSMSEVTDILSLIENSKICDSHWSWFEHVLKQSFSNGYRAWATIHKFYKRFSLERFLDLGRIARVYARTSKN